MEKILLEKLLYLVTTKGDKYSWSNFHLADEMGISVEETVKVVEYAFEKRLIAIGKVDENDEYSGFVMRIHAINGPIGITAMIDKGLNEGKPNRTADFIAYLDRNNEYAKKKFEMNCVGDVPTPLPEGVICVTDLGFMAKYGIHDINDFQNFDNWRKSRGLNYAQNNFILWDKFKKQHKLVSLLRETSTEVDLWEGWTMREIDDLYERLHKNKRKYDDNKAKWDARKNAPKRTKPVQSFWNPIKRRFAKKKVD